MLQSNSFFKVVNTGSAILCLTAGLRLILQGGVVVRLAPPGERIGIIGFACKDRILLDRTTAAGADQGREPIRVNPDLIVAVPVQVQHLRGQILTAPEISLGLREIPPDGLSQMRQVETAEDAVPVRVVALRSPDRPASRR